jgi:hypothetical protein
VLLELWETVHHDDGTPEHLFIPADGPKNSVLTSPQRLLWTVEAPS